jgi:NADPH-dependent ferric siderophore reductase
MVQIFDQMAETAARLLLRQGTVTRVTDLPGQLRQIDMETSPGSWSPGQKVQVHISGRVLRTFTPSRWTERSVSLLVHTVGSTPASRWAGGLSVGAGVRMLGPRPSLDLSRLAGAPIMVGDETSVGLAAAWSSHGNAPAVASVFECDSPEELGAALGILQLGAADVLVKRDSVDGHLDALTEGVVEAVRRHPDAPLVLTGRSQTISAIRRHLKGANLRPTSFVKTYWDPNRTGLD